MTVPPQNRESSSRLPVPIPAGVKERLRDLRAVREVWTWHRRGQLHREYERRREHYWRRAQEMGIEYRDADVAGAVRARIAARGYAPPRRSIGEVHTFACIPSFGWHWQLLRDLRELGPLTHFDYTALGFDVLAMAQADRKGNAMRREMLARVIPAFREAHARRPVDWIFCYGGGQDTSPAIIRQLTEEFGVPTVNMSLDDKQGWAGRQTDECRTGTIDITRAFDLYMTSARVACEWHMVEGGRPIYLPEGFDAAAAKPVTRPDMPVSFVGGAYGFRRSVVEDLQAHGIPVTTFGPGWPRSHWVDDVMDVFARSQINLGMGGIEYSEDLTNVKTRDFEIPGAGGGVYLTSFNADLAQHFVVGEEILCYRTRDELIELLREYIRRPDECRAISARARARCLREHRWLHRYAEMLRVIGVLPSDAAPTTTTGQWPDAASA